MVRTMSPRFVASSAREHQWPAHFTTVDTELDSTHPKIP
jgi:hypothetical protein